MSSRTAAKTAVDTFESESKTYAHEHRVVHLLSPFRIVGFFLSLVYIAIQRIIVALFKPRIPSESSDKPYYGRIAIIGAGLTGISSAAHAHAHGFDVVIYETGDEESVGGIWAHVNKTSGLQLNSLLYRFFPGVMWSGPYPHRDEIVGQIRRVWKEYGLASKTRFNTKVQKVTRADASDSTEERDPTRLGHARWLVNDGEDGIFDAIVVCVGTCGAPMMAHFPGMPTGKNDGAHQDNGGPSKGKSAKKDENVLKGPILHSSQLDSPEASQVEGRTVVVIGSGASGVEAVETALERGAKHTVMLARDDKWIIPRNIIIDTLIAMQPFGREMPLSFLWEQYLAQVHYRGVKDLVPPGRGLFEGTPVVNDVFLEHVRNGACEYVRGDTERLTHQGVQVNVRPRGSKPGDKGEEREIKADVVVLATGFEHPTVDFLPDDLFPEGYARPDLYLQNFATEDWSVLMTNSAYMNAIGTVGHFHIGIYMRILLTLLLDPSARPTPRDMKLWVDVVRFVKRGAKGGALGFFTYMELTIWLILFHALRPDRLRWMFFIMQGWGVYPGTYNKEAEPVQQRKEERVEQEKTGDK